ncbi:MFS transporter [Corynebacterium breve]|uniref:MFS transporter n=1 Tax=Corynebacterium breve TaxID=3049799 RepID=A0ABY8VHZ0_9CORY|nr:MFS transporter [Corynebacterium breve]WIM68365.1 MFS transporter [Corynebacterium breve]
MSQITPTSWARAGFGMFAVGFGANLFAPMLHVYRNEHGSSDAALTAMLGAYAVGLIPSLLFFGALSDREGRKAVMLPGLFVSMLGSAVLAMGAFGVDWPLFIGRVIIGVSVGMGMASGTAWINQLSTDNLRAGPTRSTIAVSGGFGFGPLLSGLVAEFAPAPQITPYVVHIALTVLAIFLVRNLPETQERSDVRRQLVPPTVLTKQFFWAIAAWAPWSFGVTTTAFASTPANVPVTVNWPLAFLGVLAFLTPLAGVLIQPVATRLGAGTGQRPLPLATVGLGLAALGLLVTIATVLTESMGLMLLAAFVLGGSYGIMMVGGISQAKLHAPPEQLGGVIGVFYSLAYLGFFIPFVTSLVVSTITHLAGVDNQQAYIWVLIFGMAVCAVSIRPVARASK